MNRYRLFLLLLCLLALVGCKKKPEPIQITPDIEKNHLQRNHIFGQVKSIQTSTYLMVDDSLTLADTTRLASLLKKRKPDIVSYQQYTSDGFLTRFVKLDEHRDTLIRREYHYNDLAHPTRWEEYDSTGTQVTHGKYLYDRNHFLIGEQIYCGDSIAIAFSYTTDGIGNILTSSQSFGDVVTHTRNRYNEQGQVYKITECEPNGKVFKTVTIEYDNYGDEVNRCVYKSGNQMLEYTYNQYDQDGRQIKTIYEDRIHHRKESRMYMDFDPEKNWKMEVLVEDNQIISVRKRKITYYQAIDN